MNTKTIPHINPAYAFSDSPAYRWCPETKQLYKYSKEHKSFVYVACYPNATDSRMAISWYETNLVNLKWD